MSHGITLVTRRTIHASADRLFEAWTQPDQLRAWWGPRPVTCSGAEVDLRVGGRYRIFNTLPDGSELVIEGEFQVVLAPHKLVYTWRAGADQASRVTVRFEPRGEATEVIVLHEQIPNERLYESHEGGWIGCLDGLERHFLTETDRHLSTAVQPEIREPATEGGGRMQANLFRLTLEVKDLARASELYSKLFATSARSVGGGRVYVDLGHVTVALLDTRKPPRPIPEHLYFSVPELETVHARAKELGCLSDEQVHGERGGDIVERPWGERSFYAVDPWGNRLCFVDEKTLFTGHGAQR
jgi:uncharacterized protein YndB with AHSA1/START domain/predicted enzyme related to lactoylglutathione lyase